MEYILRTNTVSKKYTNYYAVDKVSISIKKGEIYGLIGENGAGKSTLMKMIRNFVAKKLFLIMILPIKIRSEKMVQIQ